MGKHFGNLQRLKGVYYYTLSPMEINPMTMLGAGFNNTIRKSLSVIKVSILQVSAASLIYFYSMKTYHELQRKNPDDYKDDE